MFRSAALPTVLAAVCASGCFAGTPMAPNDMITDAAVVPDGGDAGNDMMVAVDGGCDGGTDVTLTDCAGFCVDETTDPGNCGACAKVCSSCTHSICAQVASANQGGAGPITQNTADVFWVNTDGGSIMSLGFGATATPTTVASGQTSPVAIAVDAETALYWADAPAGNSSGGAIVRMAIGTSGAMPVTLASGLPTPVAIAVGSGTDVYWTQKSPPAVVHVNKTMGGTPATLVSIISSGFPQGIAVDPSATNVYWTDRGSANAIMKAPVAGGMPSTFASNQKAPWSVAVDSQNVYWTNDGNGAVVKQALATGGMPLTLFGGATNSQAFDMVVSSTNSTIYWTDTGRNEVLSVPIGGGTASTLEAGLSGISGIAVATPPSIIFVTDPVAGELLNVQTN